MVMGHSVGEYAALVAADALQLADATRLLVSIHVCMYVCTVVIALFVFLIESYVYCDCRCVAAH